MTLERGKITYGVDTHMEPETVNDVKRLLKVPFE
jgi:hypothetical protein